jgi:hypothetical protein
MGDTASGAIVLSKQYQLFSQGLLAANSLVNRMQMELINSV